ncbi:hypothetical protein [Tunturiibacter gelidoferens]|uniref:Uncharacterized protein n=1 Tax=Tunturiibacter gelidiferens TaxID=3069689 RepID=A0A9X0U4K4_9BACT|nr:hypothetical protein [Edaphobacter lichenicola]MBB5329423.1 hypothetical protein [Edaphobacter lichenicola]
MSSGEWLFAYGLFLLFVIKITALILGFLTIRMGAMLIKTGALGEFKFSTSFNGAKADLASVSPGLLFVLLGIGLIGYSVWVKKSVDLDTRPAVQPAMQQLPGQLPPTGHLPGQVPPTAPLPVK